MTDTINGLLFFFVAVCTFAGLAMAILGVVGAACWAADQIATKVIKTAGVWGAAPRIHPAPQGVQGVEGHP